MRLKKLSRLFNGDTLLPTLMPCSNALRLMHSEIKQEEMDFNGFKNHHQLTWNLLMIDTAVLMLTRFQLCFQFLPSVSTTAPWPLGSSFLQKKIND